MDDPLMEHIFTHWPRIRAFVPPETVPVDCRNIVRAYGYCTHPQSMDEFWVHSRGGKKFMSTPTVPDSFFWLGIQDRGNSEYLFLMWSHGGRKFWFYDQYVAYQGRTLASVECTRDRLDAAFQRWESTSADIVFSGPWGWFNSQDCRFEEDPVNKTFREDWEPSQGDDMPGWGRIAASWTPK